MQLLRDLNIAYPGAIQALLRMSADQLEAAYPPQPAAVPADPLDAEASDHQRTTIDVDGYQLELDSVQFPASTQEIIVLRGTYSAGTWSLVPQTSGAASTNLRSVAAKILAVDARWEYFENTISFFLEMTPYAAPADFSSTEVQDVGGLPLTILITTTGTIVAARMLANP